MNYDEAIKDNQELKEKYTTNLRSNQMFDNVDEALRQATKEHRLLELYQDYNRLQEAKEFHERVYLSLKAKFQNYREDQIIYEKCLQDIITKANQIELLWEELK